MKIRILAIVVLLAGRALAGIEEDWQQIVALDAGPKPTWKTREQVRTATLAHLDLQEKALRDFLAKYPADSRDVDAQLRLAHLLAIRGDLQGSGKGRAAAMQLLDKLSKDAPKEKLDDVEFAKISLFMDRVRPGDESARAALLNKAQAFRKAWPGDRRLAALFAEVATLYDTQPPRKKELLEIARATAGDTNLQQRIDDDLKRIAMLEKPLALKFTSTRGEVIDAEKLRGKIVLIYFFADWSPSSIGALDAVQSIAARFGAERVQPLGISLDQNAATLDETLRAHKIDWPIFCDGQGWQSPLVRGFGINSLPTFWILDGAGCLRTLNARDEASGLIEQLIRER